MATVESLRPSVDHLESRLEFETLLVELSSRFVNLRPQEVDREIENALRQICELLDIEMAVLWQWSSANPELIVPTHTYVAPNIPQPTEPMCQEQYPWAVEQVRAGRMFAIPSLDDYPEGVTDRDTCRMYGVKSGLCVPLSLAGEAHIGALGFNVFREERDWPDRLIKRLQLVAQIFTNALARKRHELSLRKSEGRLASAVELAGLGFYEMDFVEGATYVDDRVHDLCGSPADRTDRFDVAQFWIEHLHQDDQPRVLDSCQQLYAGRMNRLSVEYRYLHPLRGEQWIYHLASVAGRDEAGRPTKVFSVLRDITPEKRAEEELRHSHAEIEQLKDRLQAESDYLKAEISVVHQHGLITGTSAAIQKVLRQVEQVGDTDCSVLIFGETGTGKELIAQAIHAHSARRRQIMVKVNCAALPSGLVESELFGREKGAFTGALTRQIGRFEVADGSTLFLDEVGELPADVQVKLLRVLQDGEFERLGSPRTIKVNVRVIAATNRDLAEEIRKGRFREDLYYRLSVFPIRVPSLRERQADIPLLVWTFLAESCARMGKKITQIPRATMDALTGHAWPGNVRELRNVIEHGTIITTGEVLRVPMLEEVAAATTAPKTLADAEREYILRVLESTGWHIKGAKGAAGVLGLNPATLYSRMKRLGIPLRTATHARP